MAGFSVKLAVEREKTFCQSYKYNNPGCECLNKDITELNLEKILEGFSSVGNRKLSDPRNSLIYFFVKWVEHFKPIFYAMENVSGILTME